MGISGKSHHQVDSEIRETTDGKKWVIVGIPSRSPLKPINTSSSSVAETEEQDQFPTTPTAVSVRIPRVPPCPAAPKKRKPSSSKCSYGVGARVFFSPPDLETVFIPRQKAS